MIFKMCPVCEREPILEDKEMCDNCKRILEKVRNGEVVIKDPEIKPEVKTEGEKNTKPTKPDDIKESDNFFEISTENKNLYLVYQGKTFEYERRGGYVWAPLHNKNYTSFIHWSNVGLLRKGDIILHSVGRQIVAISIVESESYEKCKHPDNAWGDDFDIGRLVRCKYINLHHPVSSLLIINDILQYGNYDGSPYNKNGKGKQGYLFDLDKKIFNSYLRKICSRNTYIKYKE